MLRCGLLLFIAAPSWLCSESIDHLNPRWTGEKWKANRLEISGLAFQRAFFPLVTQGPGRLQLPKNEAFILRLSILSTNVNKEEAVARLWGRIHGKTEIALATLYQSGGQLKWRCPISDRGDSLFDAPVDVELCSGKVSPNNWQTFDVVVNPLIYQQMFGWSSPNIVPHDPAKTGKGSNRVARQLSSAAWEISHLELLGMQSVWVGRIELLPPDAHPLNISPNVSTR
jgi:hypothetical protein